MGQKIDVGGLHGEAIKRLRAEAPNTRFPSENAFSLDDLLTEHLDVLLTRLPPAA
jgi:hypothetical protein